MGESYAALSLLYEDGSVYLTHGICEGADTGASETETARILLFGPEDLQPSSGSGVSVPGIVLRVEIDGRSVCTFSYSTDGKRFRPIGETFTARAGRWVGAKTGCFATALGSEPRPAASPPHSFRRTTAEPSTSSRYNKKRTCPIRTGPFQPLHRIITGKMR